MKKNRITVLISILFILLILSNAYFIHKSQTAGYKIVIGVPVAGEEMEIGAVDYTKSAPLKEQSEITAVMFALMHAGSA